MKSRPLYVNKGTTFGQSLSLRAIIGSTLPPGGKQIKTLRVLASRETHRT